MLKLNTVRLPGVPGALLLAICPRRFENVPVGRYSLVVSTATKERRVVWRVPADVSGTGKLELPVIHIPIDSIRPKRG
jgi:hypothetical protein